VKAAIKLEKKRPKTFQDCVAWARKRFQKYFHNDIKQLLHVYPLDKKTKEGRLFWSLPKRPPKETDFDGSDQLNQDAIAAAACLYANMFGISVPTPQPRQRGNKEEMAAEAQKVEVPFFKIREDKASEIAEMVEKEEKKNEEGGGPEEQQEAPGQMKDVEAVIKAYETLIKPLKGKAAELKVEEFEKDVDENYHVDFVYAFANCRARNYKLEPMDWLTVKLKAGRIVPALATTTAAIAGLQTLELLKYLKGLKVDSHRNCFLNLAVPTMMLSEPAPPIKTKLKEGLEVDLWDRWELKDQAAGLTLREVIQAVEDEYGLIVKDVFHGSKPVFLSALMSINAAEKEKTLGKAVSEICGVEASSGSVLDLTLTVASAEDESKILDSVPPVRIVYT